MKMNTHQQQMVDQEIREFGKWMQKFTKLFEQGYMSYSMFESQHAMLQKVNEEWKVKNSEAETNLNKTIAAVAVIEQEGKDLKEKSLADIQVLYAKANAKVKEIEHILDSADKKRAKESLKQFEVLTA